MKIATINYQSFSSIVLCSFFPLDFLDMSVQEPRQTLSYDFVQTVAQKNGDSVE